MNINTIKKLDSTLDYIPIVSTISNLVNIIAKITFENLSQGSLDFSCFAHLSEKSYVRCITLLIPILGNMAVFLYDTTVSEIPKSSLREKVDKSPQNIINARVIPTKNSSIETLITTNLVKKKNIAPPVNNSHEEEIDRIQQRIQDNYYKELQSKKNQLNTTNKRNSSVFVPPIGINNPSKNCWCIAVLQILCNTSLYEYIMKSDPKLQQNFPKLFEFLKTYKATPERTEQLGKKIKEIRIEINRQLGNAFPMPENKEADAIQFILELLEKLNLDYHIAGFTESRNWQINDSLKHREEPCIFIESHRISKENLDIDEIFEGTSYELVAALRTEPAHYSSLVKANDSYWYKCNDRNISKLLKTFQSSSLENDQRIFLIGYRKNSSK